MTKKTMWAICQACAGEGRVENPAFSNGFTSHEWADMQADHDDRDGTSAADRYLAGAYDVPCRECESSGKVRVPDVAAMTFGEKRAYVTAQREAGWRAEGAADRAAERAMGA